MDNILTVITTSYNKYVNVTINVVLIKKQINMNIFLLMSINIRSFVGQIGILYINNIQ